MEYPKIWGMSSYLAYIPILAALYLATNYVWAKIQNRPPSPFLCLPVIGHLYVIGYPMTKSMTSLADRYGPIIFLWFGSRPALIVSSPSAAEECLSKNDIVFCNRPSRTLAATYRGYDHASINFAPYGPLWKNLRKISAVEILSSQRLQTLATIRADEVSLLIKRLCSSEMADMRSQIYNTTMNTMTRMVFGKKYYSEEAYTEEAKLLREIVLESAELVNEPIIGDDVRYLRWLDRKIKKRFKIYKEKKDTLMKKLIEEFRNRKKDGDVSSKVKPMIQVLLELQEFDPNYYNDDVIKGVIVDLLIGGSETSTATMEWALSLLLNHPEVLKKVRTEIDINVGHERFLDESDLNHLPYLRCVVNETLRMYPPLPFLFPHESSNECFVGGYRIPRGTYLLVNIYAMQNDPKLWDNPKSFRPERFEGVEGHKIGFKMMPFGSGRRSCPGESLAIRIIGTMLGNIIQCLDLERDGDNMVDMAQSNNFNFQKAEPLSIRVHPRQIMSTLFDKL